MPYRWHPQAIDDATGFKVDHRRLKRQWDGAMVVDPDKRNPQDMLKARPERQGIPNPRPEQPDSFIATNILWEDDLTPMMEEDGNAILTQGELNGQGL
jgi:hypothetical protein